VGARKDVTGVEAERQESSARLRPTAQKIAGWILLPGFDRQQRRELIFLQAANPTEDRLERTKSGTFLFGTAMPERDPERTGLLS